MEGLLKHSFCSDPLSRTKAASMQESAYEQAQNHIHRENGLIMATKHVITVKYYPMF